MLHQLLAAASHFAKNWWDNQSMTTRQALIVVVLQEQGRDHGNGLVDGGKSHLFTTRL